MMTFKPSPEKRLFSHNREDFAEDTFKKHPCQVCDKPKIALTSSVTKISIIMRVYSQNTATPQLLHPAGSMCGSENSVRKLNVGNPNGSLFQSTNAVLLLSHRQMLPLTAEMVDSCINGCCKGAPMDINTVKQI